MAISWRPLFVASLALLIGGAISAAQQPKEAKKPAEPAKKEEPKKEPAKKELEKKEVPKIELRNALVLQRSSRPAVAFDYWPGPVLPGMWGDAWSGKWPHSWWMGGPWHTAGHGGSDCCLSTCFTHCCGGGGYPLILPPVFGSARYPAVSPFWTPYAAPYRTVPSLGRPMTVGSNDAPNRKAPEYRAVPVSASADKLFADALWLFSDENFASARDHLAAAIKQSPRDARIWYFKALSERAMKDEAAATISAENGAALELMGVTDKRSILVSLERIQGADRVFLTEKVSGSKALSLAVAADRVAELDASKATTVATTGR